MAGGMGALALARCTDLTAAVGRRGAAERILGEAMRVGLRIMRLIPVLGQTWDHEPTALKTRLRGSGTRPSRVRPLLGHGVPTGTRLCFESTVEAPTLSTVGWGRVTRSCRIRVPTRHAGDARARDSFAKYGRGLVA